MSRNPHFEKIQDQGLKEYAIILDIGQCSTKGTIPGWINIYALPWRGYTSKDEWTGAHPTLMASAQFADARDAKAVYKSLRSQKALNRFIAHARVQNNPRKNQKNPTDQNLADFLKALHDSSHSNQTVSSGGRLAWGTQDDTWNTGYHATVGIDGHWWHVILRPNRRNRFDGDRLWSESTIRSAVIAIARRPCL